MIEVTPHLTIDEKLIQYDFVRSAGPGGQNVNKVATTVQLRFDVSQANLPAAMQQRLVKLAGRRLTSDGILLIEARQYRTQEQNRQDALARLLNLLRRATERPKARRETKPSAASRRRRLEKKRQRGNLKKLRRTVDNNIE